MSYKFNPKNREKLDNPRRRKNLPPKETLKRAYLKEGNHMADIGAGIGYFTFPASDIVGESGRVFAVDPSDEMVNEINKKIKENSKSNIEVLKGDISSLEDESIDYLFMSNVLHEIDNKEEFFHHLKRVLKDRARVTIIEWKKIKMDKGPSFEHRIAGEELEYKFSELGYKNLESYSLNDDLYLMTGEL